MRVFARLGALCACFVLGLALAWNDAGGRVTDGSLSGSVGPDFTISLSPSSVVAGTYSISVNDQSSIHNFDLISPGGSSVFKTDVTGTGTSSGSVTLTPGTWTYQCDVHAAQMHGTLTVTSGATTSSTSSTSATSTTDTSSTSSTSDTSTTASTSTATSTTTTTTMSTSTSTPTTTTVHTTTTHSTTTEPTTTATTATTATTIQTTASEPTTTETTESTTTRIPPPVVGTATVHGHTIGVVVDTAVPGTAQLSLLNRRHVVARRHYRVRPGRALLRLRAPVSAHGRLTLVIVFHGSDGQSVTTRRTVRIR